MRESLSLTRVPLPSFDENVLALTVLAVEQSLGCFEIRTHVQLYSTVSLHWEEGSLVVTTFKAPVRESSMTLNL